MRRILLLPPIILRVRFVVALIACIAAWSTLVLAYLGLALVIALLAFMSGDLLDGAFGWVGPVAAGTIGSLLGAAFAGACAWAATRRISGIVDTHADGRFGAEPVVTATAVAILLAIRLALSSTSDSQSAGLLFIIPFVAALAGTFIPWQPRRPIIAGVLVGSATLIVILLALTASRHPFR